MNSEEEKDDWLEKVKFEVTRKTKVMKFGE